MATNLEVLDELDLMFAERLQRCEVMYATWLQEKTGVSNPKPHDNPSRPGEFPKKRTGFGQAGVAFEPSSKEAIIGAGLLVKLGYIENAFYMELLVQKYKRLGIDALMEQKQGDFAAILAGEA